MTIEAEAFRAALAQLAGGVTVVTMQVDGEDRGFTATSVTGLSVVPRLVLVCVMREQRSHGWIERAGHFAVNVLESSQTELGVRFANALVDDRFAGLAVTRGGTGAPLLPGSLAWLDCAVRQVLPGGDHSIIIGEVLSAEAHEGAPLVYHRRQWGTFTPA
jgi:flavin reductase (DIM6/NTAB) family NADH-FMN oxidoreductase RutF